MTQKELMGDDWISDEEMAELRGLKPSTLAAERTRGDGPPFAKDGRKVWYSRIAYREWMEKQVSGFATKGQPKRRR